MLVNNGVVFVGVGVWVGAVVWVWVGVGELVGKICVYVGYSVCVGICVYVGYCVCVGICVYVGEGETEGLIVAVCGCPVAGIVVIDINGGFTFVVIRSVKSVIKKRAIKGSI